MALIPDEPRKRTAIVILLVSVALAGLVYQYWYTPAQEDVAALTERLDELTQSNRAAQLLYARGGGRDLEEQLALYERHAMQLERLIPSAEEVPALLRSITAEGRQVDVELAEFHPEADQPGQFYTRKSYQITAVGEYHDVGQFLASIASLPRIITPIDVELERFSDPNEVYTNRMQNPVQASFRIQTYVLPAQGTAAPPADIGTQGGEG